MKIMSIDALYLDMKTLLKCWDKVQKEDTIKNFHTKYFKYSKIDSHSYCKIIPKLFIFLNSHTKMKSPEVSHPAK